MTNQTVSTADTNPVGRHGRIGFEILPRDIEYPRFDQSYVEQAIAVVAMTNEVEIDTLPHGVEKPVEAPGYYL